MPVRAARTSYLSEGKTEEDDKRLLKYLYTHGHMCYHPDMQVLTSEGWKKWSDCKEYEYFAVPNPESRTFSFEYLQVNKFFNDAEMRCFKNNRMSYKVTSNHRMYFKWKHSDSFSVYNADSIPKWGHFDPLTGYSAFNSDDDSLDVEFWLIGFYLGDGHKSSPHKIKFNLKKDRKINRLIFALESLGIEYKNTLKADGAYSISFNPTDTILEYIDLSLKSSEKSFPMERLKEMKREQLLGLWNGMIDSDGSIKQDRNQIQYSSTSVFLTNLFQTLSIYFGMDCHIVSGGKGYLAYNCTAYPAGRTSLESREQYHYVEEYAGDVFCTTTSTGFLMVRGNESEFGFICGNSPFEFTQLVWHIKLPLFCAVHFLRHRAFSFNQQSGRYTKYTDDYYLPEKWRLQDKNNKQSSFGEIGESLYWSEELRKYTEKGLLQYYLALEEGIAKEMARFFLPSSIFYHHIWIRTDLRNLLHFFDLRTDSAAQWETQQYANAMLLITENHLPYTIDIWREHKHRNE